MTLYILQSFYQPACKYKDTLRLWLVGSVKYERKLSEGSEEPWRPAVDEGSHSHLIRHGRWGLGQKIPHLLFCFSWNRMCVTHLTFKRNIYTHISWMNSSFLICQPEPAAPVMVQWATDVLETAVSKGWHLTWCFEDLLFCQCVDCDTEVTDPSLCQHWLSEPLALLRFYRTSTVQLCVWLMSFWVGGSREIRFKHKV